MDPLEIARWQFGITTVYHFWMVPLTIGLGPLVAAFQTMWLRTGREHWLRMTRFWGKIYLINVILGVATGIVQEFQFGMAWSEYSRFVGDVFGAPLALEALLAFFVESTFLGLWIFGWDRLPKRIHLATLWIAVAASVVSAYFIIVANSWMQHPVGVELIDGRPVMTDAVAVFTNNTAVVAFSHTIFGALAVGGGILLGISWYHLYRRRAQGIDVLDRNDRAARVRVGADPDRPSRDATDHLVWFRSLRIGAWVAVIAFAGVSLTGDVQAKLMFEQQPMKMAAAEAACHSSTSFSVLSVGDLAGTDCGEVTEIVSITGLLSFLAKGDFTTEVKGVNQLVGEYQQKYGTHLPQDPALGERAGQEINYVPLMPVTYWGFRFMILFGALSAAAAAAALFLTRRGTVPRTRWLLWAAVASILGPFAANSAGWIFTEMGRQPFVVAPNPSGTDPVFMFTASAVSPHLTAGELLFSLIALTAVYAVLLVVEIRLLVKYARGGVASVMPELDHPGDGPGGGAAKGPGSVLDFAY